MIIWLGFFISFLFILIVARKSIWLALVLGSYLMGIFSLSVVQMLRLTWQTLSDPSVLLLAMSVGIIPVIGGIMQQSGLMDDFVNNLPFSQKTVMVFSAAFVGMLPMPGGALLSAPLIEKSGEGVSAARKAAINVWYRHVLLLIYPLGMLLATTAMAKVNLYQVVLYLLPGFALMMLSGSLFLLRHFPENNHRPKKFNARKFSVPVIIILIAPGLHFFLMSVFPNLIQEIPLLIGVTISLLLAILTAKMGSRNLFAVARKMKPWNFALIIFGMFLLLNIFSASETSRVIAEAGFSKLFLMIGMGFILGLATGRVQVPISILLPIVIAQFGAEAITVSSFAVMFFAIYQGYVISPVHPCVLVTVEYFHSDLKSFFRLLILPIAVSMVFAIVAGMIVL